MAEGNGKMNGSALPFERKCETATFRIGGHDIQVPAISLDVLDRCKSQLNMAGDTPLLDYAKGICEVVATLLEDTRPELDAKTLIKACSWSEARGLIASMAELLRVSGFVEPGEDEAASPGTGMSIGSSPNSEPAESAAETRIE
jgi:hypothetical protein